MSVVTTLDIRNIDSRLRFLWFGFWNLFEPLARPAWCALLNRWEYQTDLFVHCLPRPGGSGRSGYGAPGEAYQRSANSKLVFLWPDIKLFVSVMRCREVKQLHTICVDEALVVRKMNTIPMLLGRTVIVFARRKRENQADDKG